MEQPPICHRHVLKRCRTFDVRVEVFYELFFFARESIESEVNPRVVYICVKLIVERADFIVSDVIGTLFPTSSTKFQSVIIRDRTKKEESSFATASVPSQASLVGFVIIVMTAGSSGGYPAR